MYQNPPNNDWFQDCESWEQSCYISTDVYPSNPDTFSQVTDVIIGPQALGITFHDSSLYDKLYYTFSSPIDLTLLGGQIYLTFWVKNLNTNGFEVRLYNWRDPAYTDLSADDGHGDYLYLNSGVIADSPNQWQKVSLLIGKGSTWSISPSGLASWSRTLVSIEFKISHSSSIGYCYFDGLNISGQTIRVAYSLGNVEIYGYKMKLINEAFIAGSSNDSTVLDQLDYLNIAECIRDKTTPWTGSVIIELDASLLQGQMMWLMSEGFPDDYPTPKQFRILWLKHIVDIDRGSKSMVFLTDDLTNAYTRDPNALEKIAVKSVAPDAQDRDYYRLKMLGVLGKTPITKFINVDSL